MDETPYKFDLHDGWPPDGEPGLFFGFDVTWCAAVLWWWEDRWLGVRLQTDLPRPEPQAFQRGKDTEDFVVKWARAPLVHKAA